MKNIPLFKVHMPKSVLDPLKDVLFSGYIGQGSKVEFFEQQLRDFLDTKYILTTNNGTAALHLALRLAGVGYGDEVITTPLTCTATNWPILANGAALKWCDIDPTTGNIDWRSIEKLITKKTKAIMIVHWGGYPCDIDEIKKIGEAYKRPVIQDSAHAFGSEYKGHKVGIHTEFACFSFQAIKHLTTVDGGMLVCNNGSQYKRGKLLRWYGIDREVPRKDFRCEEDIVEWGYKFHMNDVCAAIGIEQMNYINQILAIHRANARYYDASLNGVSGVELLGYKKDRLSSYWLYTIKVERREQFIRWMTECGIMVSRVHERNDKHSCVISFRRDLPQLEQFIKRMICIPVGWWVTKADREYIVDCMMKGW